MLVHVEIPGMSLNLQDPLLRLTGIHPRQTGGPLFCQILTDFARGGRRANSTPGPARGWKWKMKGRKQYVLRQTGKKSKQIVNSLGANSQNDPKME